MGKQQYITAFICATRRFASAGDLDRDRRSIANEIESISEVLVEKFGMDWNELDELEISVLKTC